MADHDIPFILRVRRGNPFIGKGSDSAEAQRQWLAAYYERIDDLYFVVQDSATGEPHGLAGIYRIDADARSAEWGRWVLRAGSPAAVESALLVYRCAFEKLTLETVYCRTLLHNLQVISFHDSCGLQRGAIVKIVVNGTTCDAIEHRLERNEWPGVERRLSAIASRWATRPYAQ